VEVPTSTAEITAAWLTSVLRSRKVLNGAAVNSFTVELLGGEKGITGELVRLGLAYDRAEPDAPRRLIAKFSSPFPDVRAAVQSMGFYEREVQFYNQLAESTPVRTPRCYFGQVDQTSGLSLLLLEDLAPARSGGWVEGCSLAEVRRVLDALAALHARWWRSPDLATKPWLQLRAMVAPEALASVFAESWPSFLGKLSDPSNPDIGAMGRWIDRDLDRAANVLYSEEPRTLVHNDVQGDNLFFDDGDGSVAFVDWQLTTCGRAVVDVATLIRGQLDPPIRRQHERHLVQHYRDALVNHGVSDYPTEQCWEDYQLATVIMPSRIASAVGVHSGLQAHPGAFWDVVFPRYGP